MHETPNTSLSLSWRTNQRTFQLNVHGTKIKFIKCNKNQSIAYLLPRYSEPVNGFTQGLCTKCRAGRADNMVCYFIQLYLWCLKDRIHDDVFFGEITLRFQLAGQCNKASRLPCWKRLCRYGKQFWRKQIIAWQFPHTYADKRFAEISFSIVNHPKIVLAF